MKVIDGELTETQYTWPTSRVYSPNGSDSEKDSDQKVPDFQCMKVSAKSLLKCNEVTYISDKIGLHRVGNLTDKPAISIHLYTPPYSKCKLFDEDTGLCHPSAKCTFYSRDGNILS